MKRQRRQLVGFRLWSIFRSAIPIENCLLRGDGKACLIEKLMMRRAQKLPVRRMNPLRAIRLSPSLNMCGLKIIYIHAMKPVPGTLLPLPPQKRPRYRRSECRGRGSFPPPPLMPLRSSADRHAGHRGNLLLRNQSRRRSGRSSRSALCRNRRECRERNVAGRARKGGHARHA